MKTILSCINCSIMFYHIPHVLFLEQVKLLTSLCISFHWGMQMMSIPTPLTQSVVLLHRENIHSRIFNIHRLPSQVCMISHKLWGLLLWEIPWRNNKKCTKGSTELGINEIMLYTYIWTITSIVTPMCGTDSPFPLQNHDIADDTTHLYQCFNK